MSNQYIDEERNYWFLSKLGKRVLRPGGKELTLRLLENLQISSNDDVVEFAPGTGYTAMKVLKKHPKSYTGVEINEEAGENLRQKIHGKGQKIIIANVSHIEMENNTASKILGEAILTMHADHRKTEIIREAHRLLKKGGLYGIHELGLYPPELSEDFKAQMRRELSLSAKVNAKPLSEAEWITLIEKEGFAVRKVMTSPMLLLEPLRVIDDEGLYRTLKIGMNILYFREARKRILEMRKLFRKYRNQMNAIAIVAEKV
ncbi:MAG: class I SAM-dependent methyltransferase [Chitinophagaceae bacterium]|nr:MAG: class I SAM-dependent methyltransferase [Chitinophagaceae bacterium]